MKECDKLLHQPSLPSHDFLPDMTMKATPATTTRATTMPMSITVLSPLPCPGFALLMPWRARSCDAESWLSGTEPPARFRLRNSEAVYWSSPDMAKRKDDGDAMSYMG